MMKQEYVCENDYGRFPYHLVSAYLDYPALAYGYDGPVGTYDMQVPNKIFGFIDEEFAQLYPETYEQPDSGSQSPSTCSTASSSRPGNRYSAKVILKSGTCDWPHHKGSVVCRQLKDASGIAKHFRRCNIPEAGKFRFCSTCYPKRRKSHWGQSTELLYLHVQKLLSAIDSKQVEDMVFYVTHCKLAPEVLDREQVMQLVEGLRVSGRIPHGLEITPKPL